MNARIEGANSNPNLTLRELIDATDAQWNRPGPKQESIKDDSLKAGSQNSNLHGLISMLAGTIGLATNDEIDAEVNPRLMPVTKSAVAAITHISAETFSAIGIVSCFTPSLMYQQPELCGQLAKLQDDYEAAMKAAMDHIPRRAGDAFHAYMAACEKTTMETGAIEHATGKTREEFEREFNHKFKAAIQASKTFVPRARELVQPHLKKYAEMVRSLADKKAGEEQRWCSLLKLPWKPSPWIATLYRAAEIVLEHNGAGHDPKSVAQFLDFDSLERATVERLTFERPQTADL